MKYQLDNRQRHWGITAFLVIAASLLVYYAIFHMGSILAGIRYVLKILAPIIYGVAIAYLLTPVLNFLEWRMIFPIFEKYEVKLEKRGKRVVRWICVIFSVILFLVLIYALVMMVLPQFIRSITSVIQNMPKYAESVQDWVEKFLNKNVNPDQQKLLAQYYDQFQGYLNNNLIPELRGIVDNLTGSVIDLLVFFKDFLIGSIVSVYILADKERFVAKAKMITYAAFSGIRSEFLIRVMRFSHSTFSGFISGKIIDSAIIGVLCYIGLTLMKMPYALLISVIVGCTNVIPFFGPFIGAIPSFFLILLVDPIKSIYFLIFVLILQQFDGNILGPMILGGSTGLSSFMVIVAIMIGGGLFGAPGMILGVPTFAVITTGFWTLIDKRLRKKELPTEETQYLNIDRIDSESHQPIYLPEVVKKQPEAERQRKNLFMTFWNAMMKVLKPVGAFLLKVLEKIGHYLAIGFRKCKAFFQKYGPVILARIRQFFTFVGRKLKAFFKWVINKIKNRKKPKNNGTEIK